MSLRKPIEEAFTDNALTLNHQGSDLNALIELDTEAATLVAYEGSDLNYLEAILAAIAAAPALVWAFDATLLEVQAIDPAFLLPTMSNNDLTATVTLDDTATIHFAMPTGLPLTNQRFDGTAAGSMSLALTLPAATSEGNAPYAVGMLIFDAIGEDIKTIQVTRLANGSMEYVVDGGAGVALVGTPAAMSIEIDGAGAVVCKVDAATVDTDTYTPGDLVATLQIIKQDGLLTGVGSDVVATFSHTMTVVAP